ncbi:carboxypeptidase-like regulatory domain-containing protein [uncultured Algibacter sp.]|uniref:carboxypeptidase-like regulatory domain-containing protein n=1 Tax=uncultured Algibacter sp. TaxID=298659 RepID=UPI002612D303|nr:carboxypeptidase-like regulatory domain-containing protein [uncultured Algibacter sp.]
MNYKLLFLCCFLVSLPVISQNFDRISVIGKVIVERNDISGITIFNASSNTGVITDDNGEFKLEVGQNDLIEVSALQYQNINFRVNEDIINSRSMKIFLIEEINQLDEIVILSGGLTGNLDTDIIDKQPFKPKLDVLYFGIENKDEFEFQDDNKTKIQNISMDRQHLPMVNGLNIVNVVDQLLLPLFRSGVKNKKDVNVPDVPIESIKYYFGSEFLIDNFNIPEHRVEEFIRFVESNNFDFTLLNYGKEMEFLEVLHIKSKEFLSK